MVSLLERFILQCYRFIFGSEILSRHVRKWLTVNVTKTLSIILHTITFICSSLYIYICIFQTFDHVGVVLQC